MKNILENIYETRYSKYSEIQKNAIWKILCSDYLQQFIDKDDSVLDIGAGHCEFINHIKCRTKYAIDMEKRILKYANHDVKVYITTASKLPKVLTSRIDKVFIGCFLEHLPSKDAIVAMLREIKRVLKTNGKLIILNPNIRFSTSDYWDYFDHLTPVSDRSVVEVLEALGFKIDICLPKFVPNTIKDSLPKSLWLVKLYLHLPFLFPIFGKQMFIVAHKS